MKRILFPVLTFFVFNIHGFSQSTCTPPAATGNAGFSPDPATFACAETGNAFSGIFNVENFGPISTPLGNATAQIKIDSITNFPCGLSWQSNKVNNTFAVSEVGCIEVTGTTSDAAGQYKLNFYVTATITTPLGALPAQSGEISAVIHRADSLLATFSLPPLAGNFDYWVRVTDPGVTCVALDTSSVATNLTSSGTACQAPSQFTVSVSGTPTTICPGGSSILTASAQNADGAVTYSWTPGGGSGSSITFSPTSNTTYTVIATDTASNADTTSIVINVGTVPTASFTVADTALVVTITNTSTGGSAYSWDFGDDSTSNSQNPAPHTYAANGTYTITLMVTSNGSCKDTIIHDVTVVGVFISPVKNNLSFEVFPNPSNGNFTITLASSGKPLSVNVFDLSGKTVYNETFTETIGTVRKQLNLSSLPKGVYTLHLNSEAGNGIQRLTIY